MSIFCISSPPAWQRSDQGAKPLSFRFVLLQRQRLHTSGRVCPGILCRHKQQRGFFYLFILSQEIKHNNKAHAQSEQEDGSVCQKKKKKENNETFFNFLGQAATVFFYRSFFVTFRSRNASKLSPLVLIPSFLR